MKRGPKPSVRCWPTRHAYCCKFNHKRVELAKGPDDSPSGPTYLEALDRFHRLFSLDADKGTDDYLVSALFNQYRAYLRATRKSGVPGVFEVMAKCPTLRSFEGRTADDLISDYLEPVAIYRDCSARHAGLVDSL